MISVAAVDLDDTLLSSNGTLAPATEAALEAWLNSGRRVVIATGRPPRAVADKLPPLLHELPWVCYNGAEVRCNGAVLYRNYIRGGALRDIVLRIQAEFDDAIIGMELDDELWVNRPRPKPGRYQVVDLLDKVHLPTPKMLCFTERIADLIAMLEPPPPGTRQLASGRYQFTQLLAENADKRVGLEFLLAGWGLDMRSVVAFGDDVNDIDMLAAAALGVAVDNALDTVKDAANVHTASNDEQGVAIVLEELLREPQTGLLQAATARRLEMAAMQVGESGP